MAKTIEERLNAIELTISTLMKKPLRLIPSEPTTPIVPPSPIVFVEGKHEAIVLKPKDIEAIENPVVEKKHEPLDFSKGKDAKPPIP